MTRSLKDWKKFKKVVKNIKRSLFDLKIQDIMNKSHGPWELINWINKCKLPAVEAIKYKTTSAWVPFSKEEFRQALIKCNNLSAPGPNKLTWRHLKSILKQDICLNNFINITDACINLGHWPNHFKRFSTVIIPKPKKLTYNHPKSF